MKYEWYVVVCIYTHLGIYEDEYSQVTSEICCQRPHNTYRAEGARLPCYFHILCHVRSAECEMNTEMYSSVGMRAEMSPVNET